MNISANVNAIQFHQGMMDNAAQKTANQNPEMVKTQTEMIVAEKGQEANTVPIKTQDEMMGTLLDMKG